MQIYLSMLIGSQVSSCSPSLVVVAVLVAFPAAYLHILQVYLFSEYRLLMYDRNHDDIAAKYCIQFIFYHNHWQVLLHHELQSVFVKIHVFQQTRTFFKTYVPQ